MTPSFYSSCWPRVTAFAKEPACLVARTGPPPSAVRATEHRLRQLE